MEMPLLPQQLPRKAATSAWPARKTPEKWDKKRTLLDWRNKIDDNEARAMGSDGKQRRQQSSSLAEEISIDRAAFRFGESPEGQASNRRPQ
ncbi:hypothetical protein BHM03_00030458 [Ensete ventricosum]|nr:hypothetical protein BHM03_00030458 [Ensete ventricosum]